MVKKAVLAAIAGQDGFHFAAASTISDGFCDITRSILRHILQKDIDFPVMRWEPNFPVMLVKKAQRENFLRLSVTKNYDSKVFFCVGVSRGRESLLQVASVARCLCTGDVFTGVADVVDSEIQNVPKFNAPARLRKSKPQGWAAFLGKTREQCEGM
ncbi:MAG: hypothetical protein PF443_07280 [Allgaiera sp.]|jgi:hypothetical protein|nr:hypothetical protein [Allgaiera sp.]